VLLHSIRIPNDGSFRATVVLLHGLGADEEDLIGIMPYLGDGFNVVSVRAPVAYGPGYSWFDISFDEVAVSSMNVDCNQAQTNLRQILDLLSELPRPNVLIGFSQGAMMAIGVWLQFGDVVDGVVAMSGGWLHCFEPSQVSLGPVLMTHGEYDPLVPIQFAKQSFNDLGQLEAQVQFRSFPMAHEISEDSLLTVRNWLNVNFPQ
jgi:phospholipase/carboxylesterase